MSNFGTTSLKFYRDLQQTRLAHLIGSLQVVDEAEHYPCILCNGRGFLVKNVTVSRADSPSEALTNPNNATPIKFREPLQCPQCNGNGLNETAFVSAAKQGAL